MSIFKFKQFNIRQQQAAMKVGTDGVLLGAWANISSTKRYCDIGTGTGLIALMLAQRNSLARVDAVEIDADAHNEALYNIETSAWGERINVFHSCFLQYESNNEIDLFVSNPPFFDTKMLPKNEKRQLARHQNALPIQLLLKRCRKLGAKRHLVSLVLPVNVLDSVNEVLLELDYHLTRLCWVKPTPTKVAKRVLIEISTERTPLVESELVVEIERHVYTHEYIQLTQDFYLKM